MRSAHVPPRLALRAASQGVDLPLESIRTHRRAGVTQRTTHLNLHSAPVRARVPLVCACVCARARVCVCALTVTHVRTGRI